MFDSFENLGLTPDGSDPFERPERYSEGAALSAVAAVIGWHFQNHSPVCATITSPTGAQITISRSGGSKVVWDIQAALPSALVSTSATQLANLLEAKFRGLADELGKVARDPARVNTAAPRCADKEDQYQPNVAAEPSKTSPGKAPGQHPKSRKPRSGPLADALAYSIQDACQTVGIGRSSLYRLIAAGKLKTTRSLGRTLIVGDSLRGLLSS